MVICLILEWWRWFVLFRLLSPTPSSNKFDKSVSWSLKQKYYVWLFFKMMPSLKSPKPIYLDFDPQLLVSKLMFFQNYKLAHAWKQDFQYVSQNVSCVLSYICIKFFKKEVTLTIVFWRDKTFLTLLCAKRPSLGSIHLVHTQNFLKNWHFLPLSCMANFC